MKDFLSRLRAKEHMFVSHKQYPFENNCSMFICNAYACQVLLIVGLISMFRSSDARFQAGFPPS
jgi:hypothetical protein